MINKIILDLKRNIDNIIISILCCTPMLSFILNFDNVIPMILIMLLIFVILYKKFYISKDIMNDKILILFFSLFLLLILINIIVHGLSSHALLRILYFGIYGGIPTLILYILYKKKSKFNLMKIFQYINYIYAIMSLFILDKNFWNYSPQDRMTISYYFLPVLISLFFEFFLDKNKNLKNILIKLSIYLVLFFPYLNFTINLMSRGTILSLFICIYLVFVSMQSKLKKFKIICISLIILLIIFIFGVYILEFIQSILSLLGITFSFIDKNLRLLQQNTIGNGREIIYKNAFLGILNHPIIGNGIGDFKNVFGTYPHNFILQSWYEGGFLFMFLMVSPVLYSFIKIMFSDNISRDKKYFFIFIFSLSIIRLMLSFEYWKDMFYWIYLFISLLLIQEDLKLYLEKRG